MMKDNDQAICLRLVAIDGKRVEPAVPDMPQQTEPNRYFWPRRRRSRELGYMSLVIRHLLAGFGELGDAQCAGFGDALRPVPSTAEKD
jgi:hypothetical protein